MRRRDREVTDAGRIEQVIAASTCCRLGFWDEGEVYIVPLSFGYTLEEGKYTLYFHGAKEGRKVELMKRAPKVGFEMDVNYQLRAGASGVGCECTAGFDSIIGTGTASIVEDEAERVKGLQAVMLHNTGVAGWRFEEGMLKSTCVFKLEVEKMSCKHHD